MQKVRNSSDEKVKVYRDIDLDIHRFISTVATRQLLNPSASSLNSLRFKTHIYNPANLAG